MFDPDQNAPGSLRPDPASASSTRGSRPKIAATGQTAIPISAAASLIAKATSGAVS